MAELICICAGLCFTCGMWCCGGCGSSGGEEREALRKMKQANEACNSYLLEATGKIAMIRNAGSIGSASWFPQSGIHVAEFQIMDENDSGEFVHNGEKFTAEYTLSFEQDEDSGEGYFISGKRVDKYGQTIIQEGYMCRGGDAYWKDKLIASFARETNNHADVENLDGPRLTGIMTVVLGKFVSTDNKITFKGERFSEHMRLARGKINMVSQTHGQTYANAPVIISGMTEAIAVDTVIIAEIITS